MEWQKAAWHWQDDKDARARAAGREVPARPRVPLAHTWFEPELDRTYRQKFEYRFPPHATEGAFAVCEALGHRLVEIGGERWAETATVCAATAIARHHGTRTRECKLFCFDSKASGYVAGIVAPAEFDLRECADLQEREAFPEQLLAFVREDDICAWPLFVFLARRLRLADQFMHRAVYVGTAKPFPYDAMLD